MLKWFLFLASIAGPNAAWSSNGTIPMRAILFALERCGDYIRFEKIQLRISWSFELNKNCSVRAHEDIDRQSYVEVSTSDWNQFLMWYDKFLHKREMLVKDDDIQVEVCR